MIRQNFLWYIFYEPSSFKNNCAYIIFYFNHQSSKFCYLFQKSAPCIKMMISHSCHMYAFSISWIVHQLKLSSLVARSCIGAIIPQLGLQPNLVSRAPLQWAKVRFQKVQFFLAGKFKKICVIFNFPALDFLICMIKVQEFISKNL